MINNIMNVAFGKAKTTRTRTMYRQDAEQYLKFVGIELPDHYLVDFGFSDTGDTISMVGDTNGVLIPDNLLETPGDLHAWVWVNTGTYGGKTCYHAIIPVQKRGTKTDIQPTPAERQQIEVLVAELGEGVQSAAQSARDAAAAQRAIENMSASAHGLDPGSDPTVEKTTEQGVVNLSFGIPQGEQGPVGPVAAFSMGTVTTGAAGSEASAEIAGTPARPVLNLTIPRGDPGEVTEAELQAVVTDIKAGTEATADYHLGFYLDENGDLCQVDE